MVKLINKCSRTAVHSSRNAEVSQNDIQVQYLSKMYSATLHLVILNLDSKIFLFTSNVLYTDVSNQCH